MAQKLNLKEEKKKLWKMLKTAPKNIVPSLGYDFLKIAIHLLLQ